MSIFRRLSGLLLPVTFLFLLNSCTSYRMAARPLDQALAVESEMIQVVWGGWRLEMSQPEVADEILSGFVYAAGATAAKADRPAGGSDPAAQDAELRPFSDKPKTHKVVVFVNSTFPVPNDLVYGKPYKVAIPLAEIGQVQVREIDAGLSVIKTFGALALVAGVAFLIVLATKDSCPFIYVLNGEEAQLVGEIYSGAIHPPLERHDYLPLPVTGTGPCRLKIANEVLEIQHTNLAELLVYDHAAGEKVLVDGHGKAHRIVRPVPPVNARSLAGADVRPLVVADDQVVFEEGLGATTGTTGDMDGLVLAFDRPRDADHMQLVVNARNSRWLDHVLGLLFERMGDQFKPWQESQKTGSADGMRRWSQEQGLPLAVSVLTPDGWRHVDDIDLVGPIAARESVVGIDLAGLTGDRVQVKLECGYRFWEIDSIRAGFAADDPPRGTVVALERAINQDGLDVRAELLADDQAYLDQPDFTDATVLEFTLPPLTTGLARSVVLHSKGHYDILRDPHGQPDLAVLAGLRQPGAVTSYSRDLYRTLGSRQGD